MNVTRLTQKLTDSWERGGKRAAKNLYQKPVIRAAELWRHTLSTACFIGVTGSAGKTTTKDLIHAALAAHYRARKSSDSNNRLYAVARTLLSAGPRTRFCVQELGVNGAGGFDAMLALLQPHVGVVTNVGTDHFKAFRTREAVAVEKGKLIACLPADGIAVLNREDELVMSMAGASAARVVTFGTHPDSDMRGEVIEADWPSRLTLAVEHRGEQVLIRTRLNGRHQAGSVLAALATVCALGVSLADAAHAVEQYELLLGRMSVHETARGVVFIRDDWKAPYWSLPLAIHFMRDARAPRKLIVLGTISDYGGARKPVYRAGVEAALEAADTVLLVGPHAPSFTRRMASRSGGRLLGFATVREASEWLNSSLEQGDLVLLKGAGDHLARLALATDQDVRCWRTRCSRQIFCDRCRLLRVPTQT